MNGRGSEEILNGQDLFGNPIVEDWLLSFDNRLANGLWGDYSNPNTVYHDLTSGPPRFEPIAHTHDPCEGNSNCGECGNPACPVDPCAGNTNCGECDNPACPTCAFGGTYPDCDSGGDTCGPSSPDWNGFDCSGPVDPCAGNTNCGECGNPACPTCAYGGTYPNCDSGGDTCGPSSPDWNGFDCSGTVDPCAGNNNCGECGNPACPTCAYGGTYPNCDSGGDTCGPSSPDWNGFDCSGTVDPCAGNNNCGECGNPRCECPAGWSGSYPNCISPVAPPAGETCGFGSAGWNGIDCTGYKGCPDGSSIPSPSACPGPPGAPPGGTPLPSVTCPEGQIGTPPFCTQQGQPGTQLPPGDTSQSQEGRAADIDARVGGRVLRE